MSPSGNTRVPIRQKLANHDAAGVHRPPHLRVIKGRPCAACRQSSPGDRARAAQVTGWLRVTAPSTRTRPRRCAPPRFSPREQLNAAQETPRRSATPAESADRLPWAAQRGQPYPHGGRFNQRHPLWPAPMVRAVHSGYIHGRRGAIAPVLLPRRHEPRPRSRPPVSRGGALCCRLPQRQLVRRPSRLGGRD